MIRLTRLNGTELALNPDLVHRAEETPDTVLTLIDGSRYVVVEPIDEIVERIVGYRARVVAQAGLLADGGPAALPHETTHRSAARAARADARTEDGTDDGADLEADGPHGGASVVRLRARRA